jgi:hypothetical protein
VILRLLTPAKPSALETFAADDDNEGGPEEGEDDSDGEYCMSGIDGTSRFALERRTSSMRRSIQNFDAKIDEVQQLVQRGDVEVEHEKNSRAPNIEKQGNLVVYEHDQLLLRSTIKRSPPFREMVMQLWTHLLAAEKVTASELRNI